MLGARAPDDGHRIGPRVEPRLDQHDLAAGDREASQQAQHLVGLAAEHAAGDDVHPAVGEEHRAPECTRSRAPAVSSRATATSTGSEVGASTRSALDRDRERRSRRRAPARAPRPPRRRYRRGCRPRSECLRSDEPQLVDLVGGQLGERPRRRRSPRRRTRGPSRARRSPRRRRPHRRWRPRGARPRARRAAR